MIFINIVIYFVSLIVISKNNSELLKISEPLLFILKRHSFSLFTMN